MQPLPPPQAPSHCIPCTTTHALQGWLRTQLAGSSAPSRSPRPPSRGFLPLEGLKRLDHRIKEYELALRSHLQARRFSRVSPPFQAARSRRRHPALPPLPVVGAVSMARVLVATGA